MHRARAFCIASIAGVVLLLPGSPRVGWSQVTFVEEFNGPTLDPAKWYVDLGDGSMYFREPSSWFDYGGLNLSSGVGQFPYITPAHDPFPPQGDFTISVGLRFPVILACSTGFGEVDTSSCFGVWQDVGGGLRARCGAITVTLGGPSAYDSRYHQYGWWFTPGECAFYYDGYPVTSGVCDHRPTGMYFGHPPHDCDAWTTLEIDYVRVAIKIPSTPAHSISIGQLKAKYAK